MEAIQSVVSLFGSWSVAWIVFEWVLRLLAVFVMPRNRPPTAGLTWLTFTFLIPVLGWAVFLVLGSSKLPPARRHIQKHLDILFKRISDKREAYPADLDDKYTDVAQLAWSLAHLPVDTAKSVTVLTDYAEAIAAITESVRQATKTVHIEYYIIVLDAETEQLFQAIEEACRRGVTVRVLYDTLGAAKSYSQWRAGMKRLKAAGVHVRASLPLRLPFRGYTRIDLRNHRKIVVIDGQVGYTGSQNIIARSYHRKDEIVYDDLVVKVVGNIVQQLEVVFAADWLSESGERIHKRTKSEKLPTTTGHHRLQLLPSGPGYQYENNLKIFNTLIYAAQKSIVIVNPYFVPEESLMTALISAARRGVDVIMINSKVMDQRMVGHAQRSYYEELFLAGVRIYWYKKPVLLHSKFIVIDDEVATVGSSNMDIRSFELNHELTLICYDQAIARQLRVAATGYLEHSDEVDKIRWLHRPRYKQLLDNIARLTSSLQ